MRRAAGRVTMSRSASITRWAPWIASSGSRNSALASSKFSLRTVLTYSGAKDMVGGASRAVTDRTVAASA